MGKRQRINRDQLVGFCLTLPVMIWLLFFLVYPFLNTIVASFHSRRLGMPGGPFVGLDIYRYLLTADEQFWAGVSNSVRFTFWSVVLQIVFGLVSAVLLNRSFRGRAFLRTWIILPWVVPFSVVAIMARWMLSSTFGIVNWVMLNIGLFSSPVSFLASPQLAMPTAIAVNVYKWFAFVGVMYLAVLQGIPNDLYEAARIDGSNKLQEFRYITLPALLPTVGVMSLLMTFWNFNTFGLVWLLTGGGPGMSTTTLPILVYRRAFQRYRLSEAAALSVVMFVFLFVYTMIYQRIKDRAEASRESYGARP